VWCVPTALALQGCPKINPTPSAAPILDVCQTSKQPADRISLYEVSRTECREHGKGLIGIGADFQPLLDKVEFERCLDPLKPGYCLIEPRGLGGVAQELRQNSPAS
jgi:hypothetical protein